MKLGGLLWVPAAVLAGCSILYDPDNLKATDAPIIDAPIDAPTDADPNVFDVTGIEPAAVDEGTGAAEPARPVLFVVSGTSLIGDAANVRAEILMDATGDGGVPSAQPTVEGFDIASNATQGGIAVRIPVLPELGEGRDATLRITVTQGGVAKTRDVTVRGRDELSLTAATLPTFVNGRVYSEITVPAGAQVHFTGADPIRLRATAGITLDGVLDVDAVGQTPGAHGCGGGASDQPGNCSPGGGRQGTSAAVLMLGSGSGGGGGAFGAVATGGSGQMAGTPGQPTGTEMLVPIETGAGAAGNRGNGGGGGGSNSLGGAGGAGGGGGGVIYLWSGGHITVGTNGAVRARGGNGASANGSSGGGGSGGAILVRAGGTIVSSTRWLSAPAGTGGTGGNAGGAGSAGRIRVDTGGGDVPGMANNPSAVQGPAWSETVALTTSMSPFTARLRGKPQASFDVTLNGTLVGPAMIGVAGTVDVTGLALVPGKNTLCALALTGDVSEESITCVDVFFIGD